LFGFCGSVFGVLVLAFFWSFFFFFVWGLDFGISMGVLLGFCLAGWFEVVGFGCLLAGVYCCYGSGGVNFSFWI